MTMTPDQCFNQMALLLNMPEDSGYEGILENLKFLKEEKNVLFNRWQEDGIKHNKEVNDMTAMFNFVVKQEEEKVKRIQQLVEENTKLAKDFVNLSRPRQTSPPRSIQDPDLVVRLKKEIDDLKKEIEILRTTQE